jgi:Ca2+-binding RTX toxin-like protein
VLAGQEIFLVRRTFGMNVFNPVSAAIIANETLDSQQFQPRVTSLEDGRFLVTWTSKTDPTTEDWFNKSDIYGQIFSADGTPSGPELVIEGGDGYWDQMSEIAALPGGGFVATWLDGANGSGDVRVKARVFDSTGSPTGDTFTVSGQDNNQSYDESSVAALSDGRFVVVHEASHFTPYVGTDYGIQAEIHNADGSVAVPTFWVSTTPNFINEWPVVRALNEGRFAVTWQARVNNFDPNPVHPALDSESNAILIRLFASDGTSETDPIIVNTTEPGSQWDGRMAVLADGGMVITWTDAGGDGNGWGVRGQILESDGSRRGTEFLVNTTIEQAQDESSVTALPGGGFVVVWESDYQGIMGQVFSSEGTRVGGETVLFDWSATPPGISDPYVTGLPDGRIVLVSSDVVYFGVGDAGSNIHAQVFDIPELNGTPTEGADRFAYDNSGHDIDLLGGDDDVIGGFGNDQILGNIGNDTLDGSAGDDRLIGGTGDDEMFGGAGSDTAVVNGSSTALSGQILGTSIDLTTSDDGTDVIHDDVEVVEFGDTTLSYAALSTLISTANSTGTTGDDTLIGTPGQDTLDGLAGNDLIEGRANADVLLGGEGVDTLRGEAGNDTLDGGAGADVLEGGEGDDVYVTDGTDTLTEVAGQGTDAVQASGTTTLGANIENLTLTGTGDINGTGNALGNVLVGNSGNNMLMGGDGVDTLNGAAGDDTLDGGAGQDSMIGGIGNDVYITDGTDILDEAANGGIDEVRSSDTATLDDNIENLTLTGTGDIAGTGNALNNQIVGNAGNNTLSGGTGEDVMSGGDGMDSLEGGFGNDSMDGGGLFDRVHGGGGNDTIDGGAGADHMMGGTGDDLFRVDDGGDIALESADEGSDTVEASVSYTISANIESLRLTGTGDIDGTGNADANTITGNSGANALIGFEGNDTVLGADGADSVYGGDGNDFVAGGADNDFVVGDDGNDTLYLGLGDDVGGGGSGNDLIYGGAGSNAIYGALGNDTVQGGTGSDTIYGGGDVGTNILLGNGGNDFILTGGGGDLVGGGDGNDTIRGDAGNDTLYGSVGNDDVGGGAGNDTILTDVGDDIIYAGLGNDFVGGGAGNDLIFGGAGSNVIYGGTGVDTVNGGTGDDTINGGGDGANRLLGNGGADSIIGGSGGELIGGGEGNDTLLGNDGADTIYAGAGNDFIGGGTGNDLVVAGAGSNTIYLGAGDDRGIGGFGRDVFIGGPGADTFQFNSAGQIGIGAARSVIADFAAGEDHIDLSVMNTQFNSAGGLTGGGTSSFFYFAAGGLLIGDQDGNGAADWVLELSGAPTITADDFILA